jgi:ATP/maltotriose-dependent transcriptional regulator MalT/DNA-binding SARP family transcriptional activator
MNKMNDRRSNPVAIFAISWLGPPVLEIDGRPFRLEMRKTLALLAYLSLSPQNPTRETLASLFWPDHDQQHALSSLRRNLYSLAKSVPPGLIEADREKIGLRREDWLHIDVEGFRGHLAFGKEHSHPANRVCLDCLSSLEKAVAVYKGDFLEGFNLKDCPGFDEWQLYQRESLRSEYSGALEKLAAHHQDQKEWEKAIAYARRWVALDCFNESAQRMLIGLYSKSGQRSMALRQYDILFDLLKNEFDQVPEAETNTLYQSLLSVEAYVQAENGPTLSSAIYQRPEPLIKTKLYIPQLREERVARPRLVEMLDSGSKRSLTLVSAPAGFGKTTLLASWATQARCPIAWFSIDEGDNDPIRFVTYLIAALDSVLPPDLSERFQAFTQSLQPSVQSTLIQLINHLSAERGSFILVLDDYQFIHSLDVHAALEFLLEKIPACMHLVISTRKDPPLSLARLRACDQLVEIRMKDLHFSLEESAGFLKQVMSLAISNEDVSSLETRTEGWIAGLQMAALAIRSVASQSTREANSMDSGQIVSRFIQTFSGNNRYILDYLVEEVLSHCPEVIRRFLLQSSIPERFSGPLCDAITEGEGSQNILEKLENENLFLVPLDSERQWYRYHQLFAELLRFKLEDTLLNGSESDKEGLPCLEELHLRTANWLEKNLLYGEAIHHFIAARKYDQAAALIEAQALPTIFNTGQSYTLLEWISMLPLDLFRSRPRLNIVKAWSLIPQNQFAAASEQLHTTWLAVNDLQDGESSSLIGEIALIRGVLAELSSRDVIVMREQAQLAWEKLPQNNLMLRCLAAWLLGASYYWDGDTRDAKKYFLQAIRLCQEAGNNYFTLVTIADLSTVLCEQGRFREAYQLLLQNQQEMSSGNRQLHPRLGQLYINSSKILLQWNRLEEAENHLNLGIDITVRDPLEEILYYGISIMPYLKLAQGKQEEAIRLAQECLDRLETYPLPYLPSIIKSNLIQFWIRVDDREHIEEWLGECEVRPGGPVLYVNEGIYTSLARILIWQRQPEVALKILAELYIYAKSRGRNGKLFCILALQALAYKEIGDIGRALETLEGSLRLVKSEGCIRPFVDEGDAMEELLQLGATNGVWKQAGLGTYVNNLLKIFQQKG